MDNDKIPIERVLEDMHNPNGGVVSWAARDYYYQNYATPKERKRMDREDKIQTIFAILIAICFLVIITGGILIQF